MIKGVQIILILSVISYASVLKADTLRPPMITAREPQAPHNLNLSRPVSLLEWYDRMKALVLPILSVQKKPYTSIVIEDTRFANNVLSFKCDQLEIFSIGIIDPTRASSSDTFKMTHFSIGWFYENSGLGHSIYKAIEQYVSNLGYNKIVLEGTCVDSSIFWTKQGFSMIVGGSLGPPYESDALSVTYTKLLSTPISPELYTKQLRHDQNL